MKKQKPDWVPENAGEEFATNVVPGIESNTQYSKATVKKKHLQINDFINGIKSGNRTILAKAITLIESNSTKHFSTAQMILQNLLSLTGKSMRIGITGSPGAGKSTFIDSFGTSLCKKGKKVAVLAVDPSSSKSRGSILGDKTRMEELSRQENAFIRPSPSGGALGGVARKTRETILLCEAAGFDVILIETVGVGQSEIAVRSMVDFFMLLLLPGAGDELQGIKKGSVELADALVINKADSGNEQRAESTRQSYELAIHYILPATENWQTPVLSCSSIENKGIGNIWDTIQEFAEVTKRSGYFYDRRKSQQLEWLHSMIDEEIKQLFYSDQDISKNLKITEEKISNGETPPTQAVKDLLEMYIDKFSKPEDV
jgi:LAO/AO transport system kinase